MMVEGWIDDTFDAETLYHMGSIKLGQYVHSSNGEAPPLDFIEQSLKGTQSAKFQITRFDLRLLKEGAKRAEHVKVLPQQENQTEVSIKPVVVKAPNKDGKDVAKLERTNVDYFAKGHFPRGNAIPLSMEILRALPSRDYSVRILDSGFGIITPFDEAFTIYAQMNL